MRGASAVSLASTSQCSSVDTCYKGGSSSTACTVSSGGCPPCVTFADDGCYVKVDGACPFGVDCASVWGGSTTSSGSSASSTTTSSSSGTSTGSTTTTTSSTTSSTTGTTAGTSSKSASGTSGTAGVSSSSTASSTSGSSGTSAGGSDMSVVFAIIGAAIGVIAVAVIFLTLVRRSKAAREEEEDDMANTPPAFSKNPVVQAPHSTTGAAMYSSYGGSNRAPGMGSGGAGEIGLDVSKGVSMNAVSYYNQQPPQNATAPSPRVAGRAIPSQPVGMNQSARAYGSQNYGQMGASGVNPMAVSGGNAMGTSGASQAPPTPVQHLPMGGVAPSPHTRRESYEF
jgi:hypothetical protein